MDTVSLNYLSTREAQDEINKFFQSRNSIVGVDGNFRMDIGFETAKRAFAALTGNPTHKRT